MVYPITQQGCKVNEHEDPVFEFQEDCIKEVLDKHQISLMDFCHALMSVFFEATGFMSEIREQVTGESLFLRFVGSLENRPTLDCLGILAEMKIKIMELENQISILNGENNG